MRKFWKIIPIFWLVCFISGLYVGSLLFTAPIYAAIGATAVWEVRSTGSNTAGGGYTSGGTDYSQQAAAQYALTGVTSAGAGNTVLTASAAADMVGNIACCVSGTNFTTSEWFEVVSVSVGVSITFGTSHASASICTGIGVNGVINIGGAFLIGGSLDDEWFDSTRAGNTVYIASTAGGVTYTIGEPMASASIGTDILPKVFQGYKDTRTTISTGVDRPIFALGANTFSTAPYSTWKYLIFTTTNSSGVYVGTYNTLLECKSTNSSTTANYPAFYLGGDIGILISCEAISAKGYAVYAGILCHIINCYFHDSKTGIYFASNYYGRSVSHSIIDTCLTGIDYSASYSLLFLNNVVRNCLTGITGTTAYNSSFINNIISDCVTGASWTATYGNSNYWGYNNFYNTTDTTNVTLDSTNLVASDPLLGSALVSGTDGVTSASGLVFTAVSAPFSGVTTSDCLLIKVAGTGATLGVYAISSVDSTSQLTIATTAGASKSSISYGIVKGSDFTLQSGSPCFNVGLKPSVVIGID